VSSGRQALVLAVLNLRVLLSESVRFSYKSLTLSQNSFNTCPNLCLPYNVYCRYHLCPRVNKTLHRPKTEIGDATHAHETLVPELVVTWGVGNIYLHPPPYLEACSKFHDPAHIFISVWSGVYHSFPTLSPVLLISLPVPSGFAITSTCLDSCFRSYTHNLSHANENFVLGGGGVLFVHINY
jgi:hypothetical protein